MTPPEDPQRFWWQVILDRILRAAGSANADILADRSHSWAHALVDLYGDEAPRHLIVNYQTDSTGRIGHDEAARRRRHLEIAIGDAALTAYQSVRLVLQEIGGEFNDVLYLRGMTSKIERWREIESLRRETEQPSAENPSEDN